jgi:TPP-dependent pyruvate/acetoin dehydrogenase alpha subunit
VPDEQDCVAMFERKLIHAGVFDQSEIQNIRQQAKDEADEAVERAMNETQVSPQDMPIYTYAPSPVDCIYRFDYTGLPGRRHELGIKEVP